MCRREVAIPGLYRNNEGTEEVDSIKNAVCKLCTR